MSTQACMQGADLAVTLVPLLRDAVRHLTPDERAKFWEGFATAITTLIMADVGKVKCGHVLLLCVAEIEELESVERIN